MASPFRQRIINLDDWREVTLFVFGGLCGVVLLVFVGGLVFSIATSDSEEIVSGPVTLSSEWTEFVPRKPLRPLKQTQELVLDVEPSEGLVEDNLHPERMQLSNGVLLHPEIELVDAQGNCFNAVVSRYPVPSLYKNGLSGYVADLAKDRTFTKVRVRSDFPVRLSRIVWHCQQGK
jgi:hypothetical protein